MWWSNLKAPFLELLLVFTAFPTLESVIFFCIKVSYVLTCSCEPNSLKMEFWFAFLRVLTFYSGLLLLWKSSLATMLWLFVWRPPPRVLLVIRLSPRSVSWLVSWVAAVTPARRFPWPDPMLSLTLFRAWKVLSPRLRVLFSRIESYWRSTIWTLSWLIGDGSLPSFCPIVTSVSGREAFLCYLLAYSALRPAAPFLERSSLVIPLPSLFVCCMMFPELSTPSFPRDERPPFQAAGSRDRSVPVSVSTAATYRSASPAFFSGSCCWFDS